MPARLPWASYGDLFRKFRVPYLGSFTTKTCCTASLHGSARRIASLCSRAGRRRCIASFTSSDLQSNPLHGLSSWSSLPCLGRNTAMAGVTEAITLDRGAFTRSIPLVALQVPKQDCHRYMQLLKGLVLVRQKMKAVIPDPTNADQRLILLKEDITDLGSVELPDKVKDGLKAETISKTIHDMTVDYSHLSFDAVMKELLPKGWEAPSSFETIGHIAHLNLRDEYLPFKHIIGQVTIDKNSCIKTVVNKVGILENQFRTLPLEIIAGEDRLETTVKQHMTRFKLNYAEVYWNSRLEQEHQKLVETFDVRDVVVDVMAGIGPFAIPAGQQGRKVYANDLNPRSFFYLKENIKLNKVESNVQAFCLDGRQFIKRMVGGGRDSQLISPSESDAGGSHVHGTSEDVNADEAIPSAGLRFQHAIMNLPASAVEFLDAFCGSFSPSTWRGHKLPLVHVYSFARTDDTDRDVIERAELHLGGKIDDAELQIRLVRDVAPNKRMLCITFRVPEHVAFLDQEGAKQEDGDNESRAKRPKLDA